MTSKDKPLGAKQVAADGNEVPYLPSPIQERLQEGSISIPIELLRRRGASEEVLLYFGNKQDEYQPGNAELVLILSDESTISARAERPKFST